MEVPAIVGVSVLVVFAILTLMAVTVWVINWWREPSGRPEPKRSDVNSRTIPGGNSRYSD